MNKIDRKKQRESKNKIMIGILILLLLILVGVLVFCSTKEKEIKPPTTEQELILDSTTKLGNYFLKSYPMTTTSEISNQDKLYYGLILIDASNEPTIKASQVEQAVKKALNESVKHEDIYDQQKEKIYTYNKKEQTYEKVKDTLYFTGWQYNTIIDVVSMERPQEDTYILKTRNIFVENTAETPDKEFRLYKNYQDLQDKKNELETIEDAKKFNPTETINRHKEEIPIVTYTYKRIDGNFVLESIV